MTTNREYPYHISWDKEWDPEKITDTHFFDPDYNDLRVGLHTALKNLEIIDPDEHLDIEEILKEIRAKTVKTNDKEH